MTDELDLLRTSLAQLASEERRRQGGAHPLPEDLVAYGAGELQQAAADAILEHLAVCRPCARLSLGIPSFLDRSASETEQAAFDPATDDSWQKLQTRLRGAPAAPREAAVTAPPIRLPRTRQPERAMLVLAACLAACLIGFPTWIATHRRSPAPPPIVPVNPPERTLGEALPPGAPPTVVQLRAEATALVLYLPAPQAYPRCRVEILDHDGRTSFPAAAAPISSQAILVLLAHEQLPPGEYRLRVFGIESHRRQPLGDYPLRIVAR
jgi:hypothetical protein